MFKTDSLAHRVHQVGAELPSPLESEPGFEWLYHGTTAQSAQRMMADGVGSHQHCESLRLSLDFGPGFYLTPGFNLARDWARRAFTGLECVGRPAADAEPAIVAFKFPVLDTWPHAPNAELLASGETRKMTQHIVSCARDGEGKCVDEEWKAAVRCAPVFALHMRMLVARNAATITTIDRVVQSWSHTRSVMHSRQRGCAPYVLAFWP